MLLRVFASSEKQSSEKPSSKQRLAPAIMARMFALPPACLRVLEALRACGHGAWVCGGTARDLLDGRLPCDLDLCTTAVPDAIQAACPPTWFAKAQPGQALGSLVLEVEGTAIELTTLRTESRYADGRQPDAVRFTASVCRDAVRRDFTVNALYIDPLERTLEDPTGGLADLATRRLRCIGDPWARLTEDRLRVLRGIRQAAELDLVPDDATWRAIGDASPLVSTLSAARIRGELERLLQARGRARGLMLLVRSGVAAAVLPGLAELAVVPQPPEFHPEGDVLRHTALVLAFLREPVDARLAWAALFHDFGKRDCLAVDDGKVRFPGHDRVSAERARAWFAGTGAPGDFVDQVVAIIDQHIRIASVSEFRPAKRNRFLSDPLLPLHLEFHRADCLACHAKLRIYEELRQAARSLPPDLPEPLVRGRDLLDLGIEPGPGMGRILAAIEEARFAGELETREQALALARALVSR